MNETEWQTRVKEILRDFQKISSIFENQEADALAAITKATAELVIKNNELVNSVTSNEAMLMMNIFAACQNSLRADQRRAIGIKEGADE